MNHSIKPTETVSIELLDRLVDGELGEADRRTLLLRLEAEPGGWRRCALAFLEAQGWASAVSSGKSKFPFDPDFDSADRIKKPRRTRYSVARRCLLAAAVVLTGFVAGRSSAPPVRVANAPRTVETVPPEPPRPLANREGTAETLHRPIVEVRLLGLANNSNGQPASVSVPLFAGPGLDEQWLRSRPSAVPVGVQKQLERQGYEVFQRRRLVSMQMDEQGRYLAIPVDDVQVRFVGRPL
jgi:hypothetical protein